MKDDPLGILRGTLDLLILNALSTGEKHGYAVTEWIDVVTEGSLLVEEGTLYPALHRLERRGRPPGGTRPRRHAPRGSRCAPWPTPAPA